jgi:hypothetical protein
VGVLDQRIHDCLSILLADLREHHIARLTFNERRDLAVLAAEQQITFPVSRERAIFDRRGTLANRYRISDLAVDAGLLRMVSRATRTSGAPQVGQRSILYKFTDLRALASIPRRLIRLAGPIALRACVGSRD